MTYTLTSPAKDLIVHFADAKRMTEVPDGSVDLVVTSPPYGIGVFYGKNDGYSGTKGQIERAVLSLKDYAKYLRRLEPVWRETYRKLKPGGYGVINVASIHAKAKHFGHSFVLPTSEDCSNFWRSMGAEYRWRYVWIAMRSRTNGTNNPPKFFGSYPLPLEGQMLREIEDILVFRKPGKVVDPDRERRRRLSKLTKPQWAEVFKQVWQFPGVPQETSNGTTHPAVYPLEVPRRIILGYSCVGDTVLDPFLGTGTTLLACKENGRKGIGYEVEQSYEPHIVAKTRLFEERLGEAW